MTTMSIVIGIFSGLMGLAVGAISLKQFFAPAPLQTPADLLEALDSIADEVAASSFQADEASSEEIATALDGFSLSVAQSTFGSEGEILSVPRSLSGLSEYPADVAFDYVAPNGISRLFVARPTTSPGVHFQVDGERTDVMRIGGSINVTFDDMTCRFELIDFSRDVSMRVRSRCE